MHLRPLVGGMVLSASLPMMGIATSPPAPSQADVSISVTAADSCLWYMENLPSAISMQSDTKYWGDPLTVSATISPALGFSGNPEVPGYSSECSFFNSTFSAKSLRVAIDSSQFTASYSGIEDESLSFGLDERPLSVQLANVEQSCRTITGIPVTVPANVGWGRGKSDVSTSFEVVAYSDVPGSGVKNFFSAGNSAKCSPEWQFEVEISSAQSGPPAGAGQTYVFSGPSLTFSMEDPVPAEDVVEAQAYATIPVQSQNAFRDLAPNPIATYTFVTYPNHERFSFSTDATARIYAGSLNGESVDFRFVPESPTWRLLLQGGTTKIKYGYEPYIDYARTGKTFSAYVSVNYRIDYRYPGADWVIRAATGYRVSNTLTGLVN